MLFEYDPEKSKTNNQKHGIDFEGAKLLWEDEEAIEIRSLLVEVEDRWMRIAKISGKMWTAIFTYRSEFIRIISVRSSRKEEKKLYEQ